MLTKLTIRSKAALAATKLTIEEKLEKIIENYISKNLKVEITPYMQGHYQFGFSLKLLLKDKVISQKDWRTR